jgi:lipoprotein-releasing system permease protein
VSFAFRIARRYIFSKKRTNAINWIAAISMGGIAVGAAALIIVLSAFNGFEGLVKQLYSSFYPDLAIHPTEGKHFSTDSLDVEALRAVDGVAALSLTLEENAIVVYKDEEHIAVLKGVDTAFGSVTAVDDSVLIGQYAPFRERSDGSFLPGAVLGAGVADVLDVLLGPRAGQLTVYMPKRGLGAGVGLSRAFRERRISPVGVFRIQQEFDARFVVVPLSFVQRLLDFPDERCGAVEIRLRPGARQDRVMAELQAIAGPEFQVRNRYQLNPSVYKVMRTEKWAVYLVLTFILIVAAFNMIGSISMLVIDKKTDIAVLRAMGASRRQIQGVFLLEGLLQTVISMAIGFSVALFLLLGQLRYGWLKIPGSGSFVVQSYPVELQLPDFILVGVTILVIGSLAAWFPARQAARARYALRTD